MFYVDEKLKMMNIYRPLNKSVIKNYFITLYFSTKTHVVGAPNKVSFDGV